MFLQGRSSLVVVLFLLHDVAVASSPVPRVAVVEDGSPSSSGGSTGGPACECIPYPPPGNSSWVKLPEDLALHAATPYETPWYCGRVVTPDGKVFGVLLMFLLASDPVTCAGQIELVWAALADADSGTFMQAEQLGVPFKSSASPFSLTAGEWGVWQVGADWTTQHMAGFGTNFSFSLSLDARDAPVLAEGVHGFIESPTCLEAHLDQPRVAANGSVTVGGETFQVSGTIWYQHVWGSPRYALQLSWHWFCAELSGQRQRNAGRPDGSSVQLLFTDEPYANMSYGNVAGPGGQPNNYISASDMFLSQSDPWVSPRTGFVYNTSSVVTVPSQSLKLYFQTYIQDNEVIAAGTHALYEGVSRVWGTHGSTPVTGNGFTERLPFDSSRSLRMRLPD